MTRIRRTVVLLAALMVAGSLTATACGRGGSPPQGQQTPEPTPTPSVSAGSPTPSPTGGPPVTSAPPSRPPTASPSRTPSAPPTTSRPPAPPFPPSLAGKDVERIPTTRAVVALTFDAGANADGLSSILATLAAQHVTATFFLTGNFTRTFPDKVRSITRAGYRVGNHSVSHPHFPALTDAQMRAQLSGTEDAVRAASGVTTRPFFRFPYGDRTAHTIAVVNGQGYVAVRWTVDSLGWQGTSGGRSVASVTSRVLAAATPGEIVLMHVGSNPDDHSTLDADALPGIITGLRQRGYTFVTLDALLGT